MRAALATEASKFIRSRVPVVTTLMLTVGIALLVCSMLLAVDGADPQTIAKFGALADPGGWAGFLTASSQVTAVAGLLGFGIVLSWLYGREFADGTVTGLFAPPSAAAPSQQPKRRYISCGSPLSASRSPSLY